MTYLCLQPTFAEAALQYTGVNLFGAEFDETVLPGNYNQQYIYPNAAEVDYFMGKGMNVFRLPFRWERLQRSTFETLHATELSRMDTFVNYATSQGAHVILDPHNFMRYYPDPNNFQSSTQGLVGTDPNVPISAFEDFWSQVADHYKDNDKVVFNLMNEPNTMETADLVTIENAAIQAIRDTGAENLILVPGNQWTGAWAWNETWYNGPNAVHMLNIVDPADNYAFDAHQYLDSNSSGGSQQIVNENIGQQRLMNFTNWLQDNDLRGFLGEFAVGDSTIGDNPWEIGDEAIENMLGYMEANDDVWLGWTWWAAGPWFTNYFFSLEPNNLGQLNESDRIQMSVLEPHLVGLDAAADFDSDGDVDHDDLEKWLGDYGLNQASDADGDGDSDGADFLIWQQLKKSSIQSLATASRDADIASSRAVPEPSVATLAIAAWLIMGCARSCDLFRLFR